MNPVLVVQHLEPEQPAVLGDVLARAGCLVDVVRTDLGEPVPTDVDRLAGLVVLGGPMSATSDDDFPSRRDELTLLERAVTAGLPTLGVCLGAQLLAVATGGAVRAGGPAEIGWGAVSLSAASIDDPLLVGLGPAVTVLHWHGETFDLPPEAIHLARSSRYPNQAFRVGPAAWGLQFHVEIDEPAVHRFVEAFPTDAARAEGGATSIMSAAPDALAELAPARDLILDRFARLVSRQVTLAR
jgi:GMP synthase-like glutamine amidotransferase